MKILRLRKLMTDMQAAALRNTFVKSSQIVQIVNEDADIFDDSGNLLARFRKRVMPKNELVAFYDATMDFTTNNASHNRGSASGSKTMNMRTNPPVKSSIIGYFDKWAPTQKAVFKRLNVRTPLGVRATWFTEQYVSEYKQAIPLLKTVNRHYKALMPRQYAAQNKKAKETPFTIANTAFTTATVNVNFQTAIHKDRGDDEDGFGNLVVIERGRYTGGETCFPQYGVGVNVREGDILFMNVHEWHGNLPVKRIDADAVRMSVVCYLRTTIWERTRGKSEQFKRAHLARLAAIKTRATKTRKTTRRRKPARNKTMKR